MTTQNDPQTEAKPDAQTPASNGATSSAQPPMPTQYQLPMDVQTKLRLVDQMYDNTLMRLGRMEVEHAAAKERVLIELNEIRKEHQRLVETAAKGAGLDIDKARWLFDNAAMMLTRVTKPE